MTKTQHKSHNHWLSRTILALNELTHSCHGERYTRADCLDAAAVDAVLRDLDKLRGWIDGSIDQMVGYSRDSGVTWEAIGDALGITKQAAQQRFTYTRRSTSIAPSETTVQTTPLF